MCACVSSDLSALTVLCCFSKRLRGTWDGTAATVLTEHVDIAIVCLIRQRAVSD